MKKILLIDDEDDIREVTALTLETMGSFEVYSAANGFEGARIASEIQPDAVLLDVMMPEIDGPMTLALIRKSAATRDTPVIFMTAKVQASDRRRLSGLGARGIISKPFDPMTLAEEVNAILEEESDADSARESGTDESVKSSDADHPLEAPSPGGSAEAGGMGMEEERQFMLHESGQLVVTPSAKRAFLAALGQRLKRLDAHLEAIAGTTGLPVETVVYEFHNLAGIAGTYGLPEVTVLAREGEVLMKQALSERRAVHSSEAVAARALIRRMDALRVAGAS